MNKAIYMGRLVTDTDVRYTPNGKPCATYTLAVQRGYKDAEGNRPVDYIDCVAWEKLAENAGKYFFKGMQILVSGRMQTRTYEDKNGAKRKAVECIIESQEFTEKKTNDQPASPVSDTYNQQMEEVVPDDFPF